MWIGYGSPGKFTACTRWSGKWRCSHSMPRRFVVSPCWQKRVTADAQDVGRVEQRLVLGGDEVERGSAGEALLNGDLVEILRLVGRIGEPGTRGLLPSKLGILVEVALHERVVGEVLPVTAAKRHRGGDDLLAHGEQHVARGHAAERGPGHEVRCGHRLVPLDGGSADRRGCRASPAPTRGDRARRSPSPPSRAGVAPNIPRMSLSSGIFASVAGSEGGMQVKSARPTMTCSSGSKSFHELTMVLLIPAVPPVEPHPFGEVGRECARKHRDVNAPLGPRSMRTRARRV